MRRSGKLLLSSSEVELELCICRFDLHHSSDDIMKGSSLTLMWHLWLNYAKLLRLEFMLIFAKTPNMVEYHIWGVNKKTLDWRSTISLSEVGGQGRGGQASSTVPVGWSLLCYSLKWWPAIKTHPFALTMIACKECYFEVGGKGVWAPGEV